jgi:xylulokinase
MTTKTRRYFAGIDAGTTGTTVMLVDETGGVAGSSYREYTCTYPHAGWVEQDIEAVWSRICEACNEVLHRTGLDKHAIESIGISSQRGTFLCVDPSGTPLHHSIVWNDCRASEQARRIAERIGDARYRRITGMPVSALWAAAKIMWVSQNRPDIIDSTYRIVNGQEFLLKRLGAEELFSDPSSLTLNGMMDIETLDWSSEVIGAIGVPAHLFPRMVNPARREGTLSAGAAAQTGFAEGTPICRGGGDQQCAAIGAGVITEGRAEITIGTAAMMVAHVNSRKADPNGAAYIGGHAIPGKWDLEGGAFSTGACLRWVRDTFGLFEQSYARQLGLDVYDLMIQEASRSSIGCKGAIFLPFFNGQVTPFYDSSARGGLIGLTLAHNRHDLLRAVLEGTAYELRMVVEALEGVLGIPFESLRLTGGGAKSEFWARVQADIYGKPIQTLQNPECTTLGAAMLGAVAAGKFGSIEEAVAAMVHTKTRIEPELEHHEMYNELYGIFRETYTALSRSGVYERIARLQDRI